MSLVDGQIPNEYTYTDTEELFLIKFIDVTDSLNTLETLRFTLILTGVALLVILYFLSRFFAGRAITPLLEAWEKQRRFVADASHELKTPLSVISGNIDVLLNNRDETVESQIKWLQYAKSGTERMSALINHLLSLSKIEDYKTQPAITELDVGELIGDAIDHVRGLADAKQITLNEAIQPAVVMNTDYSMLRQAVDILLDNAIKYSSENGLLEVRLNQTKTHILISVSNNGAGISEEDMPKIFDRFYRADKSRSHDNQSYGLGLSIAYSIMEKLGGKITANSIPNEITCFTLTFNRKN